MSDAAQYPPERDIPDKTNAMSEQRGIPTFELHLAGNVDPAWAARAQKLNDVIEDIGMGRYQVSQNCCPSDLAAFSLRIWVVVFHNSTRVCLPISGWSNFFTYIVALVHRGWFWVLCGQPIPYHYRGEPFPSQQMVLVRP